MINKKTNRLGEEREIKIVGDAGAKFSLLVKTGSNYYNWNTSAFGATERELKNQVIPPSRTYRKKITLPPASSDTRYDVFLRPSADVKLRGLEQTPDLRIATITQRGLVTATFNTTSSAASLVVQNSGTFGTDLTGATIVGAGGTIESAYVTQRGTVTKSGNPLLYVHTVPSWDRDTGGDFTNTNTVTAVLEFKNGTNWTLDSGTNISASYHIIGENIVDDITVSSISGNKIVVSADQNVKVGDVLTFSKGSWNISSIASTILNSGTNSLDMKIEYYSDKYGVGDITSVGDVDDFISVKPNVFPVEVNCPEDGFVVIDVPTDCTNAQGGFGDNDANQSTKTYKIHSLPSASTSSMDCVGSTCYGAIVNAAGDAYSADDNMGSAGDAYVKYTAGTDMTPGDTDHFYYKCVDAQGTPVASSTTQGKISITIV